MDSIPPPLSRDISAPSPEPARRPRAYTLTELLTTMAIIAILLALLLPVVALVRGVAQSAACANTLRGIGAGLTLYLSDQACYPPPFLPSPGNPGLGDHRWPWTRLLTSFIQPGLANRSEVALRTFFRCPRDNVHGVTSADGGWYTQVSYGMSWRSFGGQSIFGATNPQRYVGIASNAVPQPAETIFCIDSLFILGLRCDGSWMVDRRHRDRANALMADSRVESMSAEKLEDGDTDFANYNPPWNWLLLER